MDESFFKELEQRALNTAPFPDPRFPPSPYYRFLRLLAAEMRPRLSVELGVCGGGASFHLATGWRDGKVVGVEREAGSKDQQDNWRFIERHCPNFELWRGDSVDSALPIFRRHGAADVLFIDTVHTCERTREEWDAWESFLAARCVVCLDDLFRPEMPPFWDELAWSKVRLDVLHDGAELGGGFGVAWRG